MKQKMTKYQIGIIVCGVLSLLFFFILPCYHNSLLSGFGFLGSMFENAAKSTGVVDISAFRMIVLAMQGSALADTLDVEINLMGTVLLFGGPALISVLMIVFVFVRGKVCTVGAIVCSTGMLIFYTLQICSIGLLGIAGYEISSFYSLVFIAAAVALVLAIIMLKEMMEQDAGSTGNYYDDDERTVYSEEKTGKYWAGDSGHSQNTRMEGIVEGIEGEYRGALLPAADGVRMIIGRSAKECNLILSDPSVSRVHCYITYFADRNIYGVMDVSKYGVYDTRKKRIEANQTVFMAPGDKIYIGNTNNVFQLK